MKVYAVPDAVAYNAPDYRNYNHAAEIVRENAHKEELKTWLKTNGWAGPRTGDIYQEPVADGYAQYMYADAPGAKAMLVHLPYGDAYNSQNVRHIPKTEILKRIDSQKGLTRLFVPAAVG
jgi:hypothetical protein